MKWNEKTYLLDIFFCPSSDATLTWQSTKKKIHRRSWSKSFDSRKSVKEMQFRHCCDSRNIWTRSSSRHHENDFFTQTWYRNYELQQNYVSYRESVVDDSWRSGVKCVLFIISFVMYNDPILNLMNIQTVIKRCWDTRKYSNVIRKSLYRVENTSGFRFTRWRLIRRT